MWAFLAQPQAIVAILVAVAAPWPLGRWLARRRGVSLVVAALFVLSAGLILALTLAPNEPARYALLPPHYLTQLNNPSQVWASLTALPDDAEEFANIALYVPLGFFGRLVWRSAALATLTGMVLTVVVETCQYDIVGRDGSLTDIRNNIVGALLGAAAAVAAIWVAGQPKRAGH